MLPKSQLAAKLGLSTARISQLVKAGLPVRPDGKLDLDIALAWIKETRQQQARYADRGVNRLMGARSKTVPLAGPARDTVPPAPRLAEPDDPFGVMDYNAARAKRESMLAHKVELELGVERGKLVSVDVVESQWTKIITATRNRLLACPGRIGARIAHLTQIEIAQIDKEIRGALAELGE